MSSTVQNPSGNDRTDPNRRSGSSALRRSDPTPLVSGTDAEPASSANSGLTLGERLAREAAARRSEENDGAPAWDGANPPTGFVSTGPIQDALAQRRGAPSGPVQVGSRGPAAADSAPLPSPVPARGGAAEDGAPSSRLPATRRDTRYDDAEVMGLAGVETQGPRPAPDFLNSFDDDEVGEYVPGQWDDPQDLADQNQTGVSARRPVNSQDGQTAAHQSVRPDAPATQALPSAGSSAAPTTGLMQAVALGQDEDLREADRRRDEETPFLRRESAGSTAPVVNEHAVANDREYRNRLDLLEREKAVFGGLRMGTGFFGWLTATGMMAILSLLASAILGVISYVSNTTSATATRQIQGITTGTALTGAQGITAAIVAGLMIFISFLAGGYVAGRMARFSGLAQGFGVWLWFLLVSVAFSIAAVLGLSSLSGTALSAWLPSASTLTSIPALISLAAVLVLSLLAALLGGALGMRYHRRIDRADYAAELGEDWQTA